jgi:hypothetical protein
VDILKYLDKIIGVILMAGLILLGIYLYERACYSGLRPSECGDTLLYNPKTIFYTGISRWPKSLEITILENGLKQEDKADKWPYKFRMEQNNIWTISIKREYLLPRPQVISKINIIRNIAATIITIVIMPSLSRSFIKYYCYCRKKIYCFWLF